MMTYAMNKIKTNLKKGVEKRINGIVFKILDAKVHGGATQITAEMTDSDGRGIAIADLWGPNKRKECTIMVKKSREYDEKFVNIFAKEIIQPALDCIINGQNLENIFDAVNKKVPASNPQRNHACNVCKKSFTSLKYLKVHMTKIHTVTQNNCPHCDYADHNKIKLREHVKTVHVTVKDKSMDTTTKPESGDNKILSDLEKTSWEERRIDDELMETDSVKEEEKANQTLKDNLSTAEDVIRERSNF